jgi:hypothetical protein
MKAVLVLLTLGTFTVGAVKIARATTSAPGNTCQNFAGGSGAAWALNGAYNNTSGEVDFVCPIITGTLSGNNETVSSEWLNYHDASSTGNIWCVPYLGNTSGGMSYGAMKYTCSTGGGCTDATQSFTGYNYLSWSGTALPTGASFTLYSNSTAGFQCNLYSGTIGSQIIVSGVN